MAGKNGAPLTCHCRKVARVSTDTQSFEARFLSGAELYGDDFGDDQIAAWFEDEREGYAELDEASECYAYHAVNELHGFGRLPSGLSFRNALGVGSSFGEEFLPIVDRLNAVTILEPSDRLVSGSIGGKVTPSYVKPTPDGRMPFPDEAFDLVVCFGVLHHIPNVTTVMREIGRVTEPGGYVLIREPIISMGDWRTQRKPGITARERGIPLALLTAMFAQSGLEIVRRRVCFFPLTTRIARMVGTPAYGSQILTRLDDWGSQITRPLYHYHAYRLWQKLRPTNAFYVARKPAS